MATRSRAQPTNTDATSGRRSSSQGRQSYNTSVGRRQRPSPGPSPVVLTGNINNNNSLDEANDPSYTRMTGAKRDNNYNNAKSMAPLLWHGRTRLTIRREGHSDQGGIENQFNNNEYINSQPSTSTGCTPSLHLSINNSFLTNGLGIVSEGDTQFQGVAGTLPSSSSSLPSHHPSSSTSYSSMERSLVSPFTVIHPHWSPQHATSSLNIHSSVQVPTA